MSRGTAPEGTETAWTAYEVERAARTVGPSNLSLLGLLRQLRRVENRHVGLVRESVDGVTGA